MLILFLYKNKIGTNKGNVIKAISYLAAIFFISGEVILAHILSIEQHILDTNAGKQLS